MMWLCEKTKRKKYLRCPICKGCEIVDLDKPAPATCRCGTKLTGEAESTWASDLCEKVNRYE